MHAVEGDFLSGVPVATMMRSIDSLSQSAASIAFLAAFAAKSEVGSLPICLDLIPRLLKKYPKLFQWLFLLIVFFSLCFAIDVPETYKFIRGQAEFIKDPNQSTYTLFGAEVRYYAFDVFWRLPPLLGWLPIWINDSLFFLMNEWMPMEFWNENTQSYKTRPLVLQLTRNITAFMTFLIELIREVILGGVQTVVAFTSWDWIGANPWAKLPGLPWTIVAAGAVILRYNLSGKGLAIFAGIVMIYISIFGQWKPSMQTLSFILVAAPLSFIFGLGLGIAAFKSKRVEKALYPILLVMQTMPQYAVLFLQLFYLESVIMLQ